MIRHWLAVSFFLLLQTLQHVLALPFVERPARQWASPSRQPVHNWKRVCFLVMAVTLAVAAASVNSGPRRFKPKISTASPNLPAGLEARPRLVGAVRRRERLLGRLDLRRRVSEGGHQRGDARDRRQDDGQDTENPGHTGQVDAEDRDDCDCRCEKDHPADYRRRLTVMPTPINTGIGINGCTPTATQPATMPQTAVTICDAARLRRRHLGVDVVDRAAPRLDADEPEGEGADQIPVREIGEPRHQGAAASPSG